MFSWFPSAPQPARPLCAGLRIEDVRLPERQTKRLQARRILVQKIAQVRGRGLGVGNRKKHWGESSIEDALPLPVGGGTNPAGGGGPRGPSLACRSSLYTSGRTR